MSELRNRFVISLKDCREDICPENSQLYAAMGADLLGQNERPVRLGELYNKALKITDRRDEESVSLTPLFRNDEQYKAFKARHALARVKHSDLSEYRVKHILVSMPVQPPQKQFLSGKRVKSFIHTIPGTKGNPIMKLASILKELYRKLPKGAYIAKSTITGYGEALMKAAFHVDFGIIETLAHYKAADSFSPKWIYPRHRRSGYEMSAY